jgi:hypothetical protein
MACSTPCESGVFCASGTGLNMSKKMKKSFVLYLDSLDVLDDMSQEEIACMFVAIRDYNKGLEPELLPSLKFLFKQFANQFDRDHEKWVTTCESRALAGSKGGKQKVANASKSKQKVAKVAILADNDNDTDTVNDTVNVNDTETDTKTKSKHRVENIEERFIRMVKRDVTPRRLTFNAKELSALKRIKKPLEEHDMELLEHFFSQPKAVNFDQTWKRKQEVVTLLNNIDDQLDLAYEYKETESKKYALPKQKHAQF